MFCILHEFSTLKWK